MRGIIATVVLASSVAVLTPSPAGAADTSSAGPSGRSRPAEARLLADQASAGDTVDVAPGADRAEAMAESIENATGGAMERMTTGRIAAKSLLEDRVTPAALTPLDHQRIGIIDVFNTASLRAVAPRHPLANRFCRDRTRSCAFGRWSTKRGSAEVETLMGVGVDDRNIFLAEAATYADYRLAIDWMASNGVSVVVHTMLWSWDASGDGTGAATDVINYAGSKRMVWVNAGTMAGVDSSVRSYNGGFWKGSWRDDDRDNWLNFASNDESMGVYCGWMMGVRWSDWGAQKTDYDVYVSDLTIRTGAPGTKTLLSGRDQSKPGAKPIEASAAWLCNTDPRRGPVYDRNKDGFVNLWIKRTTRTSQSPQGDVIEIGADGFLERAVNAGSASAPFADSNSAFGLTVGANSFPSIAEWWSGRGPLRGGRVKPDVMASSCFPTTVYGGCGQSTGWYSTAVSATLAALEVSRSRAANPTATPAQIRTLLVDTASRLTRDVPRPDSGYGDIQARSAYVPPRGVGYHYYAGTRRTVLDTRTRIGRSIAGPLTANRPVYVDAGFGDAFIISITSTSARSAGEVMVYSKGSIAPAVPTLRVDRTGRAANTLAIVSGGDIVVRQSFVGDLRIDVIGKMDPYGGGFLSEEPYTGYSSCHAGTCQPLAAGVTRVAKIVRTGDAVADAGLDGAAVVSVTVSSPVADGRLTVAPVSALADGTTIAFNRGLATSTTMVVPMPRADTGRIRLLGTAGVNVRVDVLGWFQDPSSDESWSTHTTDFTGGLYFGVAPTTVLDTGSTHPGADVITNVGTSRVAVGAGTVPQAVLVDAVAADTSATMTYSIGASDSVGAVQMTAVGAGRVAGTATIASVDDTGSLHLRASAASRRRLSVLGYFIGAGGPIDSTKVSTPRGLDGAAPNGVAGVPQISADGNIVVFTSNASNLVAGDTADWNVFVWNRSTDTVSKVPGLSDGWLTESWLLGAELIRIDAAGTKAVLKTGGRFVAADTDNEPDYYVVELGTGAATLVTTGTQTVLESLSPNRVISSDLTRFVMSTPNGVKDLATNSVTLFPQYFRFEEGPWSFGPNIFLSGDGQVVLHSDGSIVHRWVFGASTFEEMQMTLAHVRITALNEDGSTASFDSDWMRGTASTATFAPTRRCEIGASTSMSDTGDTFTTANGYLCKAGRTVPLRSVAPGVSAALTMTPDGSFVLARSLGVGATPTSRWVYVYDAR